MLLVAQHLKDANNTILFFAFFILSLFCFTTHIFFKVPKSILQDKFYFFLAALFFGLTAKFFRYVINDNFLSCLVVIIEYTGYFGIQYSLIIFSFCYYNREKKARKMQYLAAILPILWFILVLTNPFHPLFYIILCSTIFLFVLLALSFHFLGILPASYQVLYYKLPRGIAFISKKGFLHTPNELFIQMFPAAEDGLCSIAGLVDSLKELEPKEKDSVKDFLLFGLTKEYLLSYQERRFVIKKLKSKPQEYLIYITEITNSVTMMMELEKKNHELTAINENLKESIKLRKDFVTTRARATVAQNVHDILGHSLTVALCTAEVAAQDECREEAIQKLAMLEQLLSESVEDLKNSIQGSDIDFHQTSLIKAIKNLSNLKVQLEITTQGTPYELTSAQNEAVIRICQEAVTNAIKHGDAKIVHLFLRYYQETLEIYLINDGRGCNNIRMGCGLSGMKDRINKLGGTFEFGSDGQKGFHIHIEIPMIPRRDK